MKLNICEKHVLKYYMSENQAGGTEILTLILYILTQLH